MSAAPVLLVSMPWETLLKPSIQLGTLQAVLDRAGIASQACYFKLAFMEHCVSATARLPEPERLRLADYEMVAIRCYHIGLGDWIFAVPPFREESDLDADYLAYVREEGLAETDLAKALAMRTLVPDFLESCARGILEAAPRVVGFTSVFTQNVPSLALAKLLKDRDPSISIVFGGSNCDGPMGAAIHRSFPWVDVVVRGEAERILPELIVDLCDGRPVRPQPGLCYRDGDRSVALDQAGAAAIAMDEVPLPNFDEYFARVQEASFYAELLPEIRLLYESARGCWWGAKQHCTFCGLNGTSMAFRSKSPERVVDDLITLAGRYGKLDFQIVDNIIDHDYLRDVLPRLRDAGFDLGLFYETKANLKKDHVRLLREAGVNHIQPGIESLSNPILKLMRKGVTAFQNVRLLKWCAQYGVHVYWNLIYGFPGEPALEYARMADVIPSLTHLQAPKLAGLALERFSPYHEHPHEHGIDVLGPVRYYGLIYPTDAAALDDLAYTFRYRHLDGRDPETYVTPLREAVERWREYRVSGFRSLRYRRGPGFLMIHDRRPLVEPADYSFEDDEARIYLACEDGATPSTLHETLEGVDASVEEIRAFLDELVALRLVYEEDGRYLSLALPAVLNERA
jgi:ribosomal peptide maturation radical SAM protein 1